MQGVLAGFVIIGIVVGVGFLLAQLRILDATAQGVLTRIAFYVASPALMVTVLGGTDMHRLLSANLIASLGSVAVAVSVVAITGSGVRAFGPFVAVPLPTAFIAIAGGEQAEADRFVAEFENELRDGSVGDAELFPIRAVLAVGTAEMR